MRTRDLAALALLAFAALLAGACSSAQPPGPEPAVPSRSLTDPGTASFFFPVEVPLAELGRMLDASVPKRMADARKGEVAEALREDFYRYEVERGPIEVGSGGEGRLTFRFPVRGKVTIGGRFRPIPLGRGLPVEETIVLDGEVAGTAIPSVGQDWRLDLDPVAQVFLSRADLTILDVVPLNLRSVLEEKLNPVLNRELRGAAGAAAGQILRKEAEAAWRALHFSRKGLNGGNLWLRFQPAEISLARISESGGVLRTGLGISGQVSMVLGEDVTPPPVSPLPSPRLVDGGEGRFELEIPVVASPAELSGLLDRSLKGSRHKLGRSRAMIVTAATVEAEGDRLLIVLDFQESQGKGGSGAGGTLRLRGRPAFDPAKNVLRIADLQYDLATKNLRLRVANRLHREKLLKGLEKAARLDFTPTLRELEAEARTALRDVLRPRGIRGEVMLEPVRVLSVGVSGGAIYARCRVAGTPPPLVLRSETPPARR